MKVDFCFFLVIPFLSVLSPVLCQHMLVNPAREVIQLGKENPAKQTNCQHKPMRSWVAGLAGNKQLGEKR